LPVSTRIERALHDTIDQVPEALHPSEASSGSFLRAILPPPPPSPPRARSRTALTVGGIGALIGATLGLLLVARHTPAAAAPSDIVASASSAAEAPVAPAAIARSECPDGMALVEGGRFFMGSDDGPSAERPAHHVTVSRFCMDRHEVTADAYRACSARGDCKRAGTSNRWDGLTPKLAKVFDPVCNGQDGRGNHPINCIDWSLAERFCHAENKRLPTEAEWEFAARGSDGRKYPWGDAEPTARHLNACGAECALWFNQRRVSSDGQLFPLSDGWATTAPVGSFPLGASSSGIEDMVGNVWEWVADAYGEYSAGDQVDPKGPATGTTRVIRGGAWNGAYADWVRPAFRFHMKPESRSHGVGFRCAKTL